MLNVLTLFCSAPTEDAYRFVNWNITSAIGIMAFGKLDLVLLLTSRWCRSQAFFPLALEVHRLRWPSIHRFPKHRQSVRSNATLVFLLQYKSVGL